MIGLSADVAGVMKQLRQLEGQELPRVIGRTLNRTMASSRSAASRFLRNRINLKKSVIDGAIRTRRSNEIQNLTALALGRAWFEIRWSGKPLPLRDYGANKTTRGVSFKVGKASRRRVYVRAGQKGFIIEKLGGNVFVRVGKDPKGAGKAPIKKVFGPSIPQFAVTKREQEAIMDHARRFWAEELQRNIRFAISKRSGV